MNVAHADFTARLEGLRRTHRELERSVYASGVALQHRLSPPPPVERPTSPDEWPRRWQKRDRRVMTLTVLVVVMGAALAATALRQFVGRPLAPADTSLQLQAASTDPPPAPVESAPAGPTIRIRAERAARARVTVDGVALEWRGMREGDEFYARPTRDMFIETSDAAALSVTVDGARVTLGDESAPASVRLQPEHAWRPR